MELQFSRSGEFLFDVSRRPYGGKYPDVSIEEINAELSRLSRLSARVAELEAELERERLRLAACGDAAMQNTEATVCDRIASDNPNYSASYADVCSAVDREMALRAERERLREALRAIIRIAPPYYEPDCEYWDWGNYPDVYRYGIDTGIQRCVDIARAALEVQS